MEEDVKEEGGNYFAKQVGGNKNRDGRGRAAQPCWRLGLECDFWADFSLRKHHVLNFQSGKQTKT